MLRILFLLCLFFAGHAPAAVEVMTGSSPQQAFIGDVLPNPVRLLVADGGAPVPGARVEFVQPSMGVYSRDAGECQSQAWFMRIVCSAVAANDGVAEFRQLTNHVPGTFTVELRATNAAGDRDLGSATLTFVFLPRAAGPKRLEIVSGGGQRVQLGTRAPEPLRVRLVAPDGSPVADHAVAFNPTTLDEDMLGFRVPPSADAPTNLTRTDAQGVATSPPIVAGWTPGVHKLRVQVWDSDVGREIVAEPEIAVVNAEGEFDVELTNLFWAGPVENGWGMSVVKHGAQLFNVLFVYDAAGQPTWYVQPGGSWTGLVGSGFHGDIYSPSSSPWFAYDASRLVVGERAGTMSVWFRGPERGRIEGHIGELSFSKEVRRQDFSEDRLSPIQGVADMWWGGPAQNGWGLAILEQPGGIFSVWFTYDAEGKPTWFVMPSGEWRDTNAFAGNIYRTSSSPWLGFYDASRLRVDAVGAFTLRFASRDRASLEYTLEGRSGTLDLSRQPFD